MTGSSTPPPPEPGPPTPPGAIPPGAAGDLPSYLPGARPPEPSPTRLPAYGEPPAGAHLLPTRPAQPPLDRWFTDEHTIGQVASVLIGVVTVTSWLTTWADWNSYRTLRAGSPDRMAGADLWSGLFGTLSALALFASAAVFVTWLWRVRWNAEMFCRGEHRFTRGWVVGSWVVPVVNLWYPKRVVDDVVAASDPRTPAHTLTLRDLPGTRLVWAWWLTWVVGLVLDNVAQRSVLDGAPELGELYQNAVMSTVSAVSTSAAAVLAVLLVRRVNDLQTRRPWVPWWAVGPPGNAAR